MTQPPFVVTVVAQGAMGAGVGMRLARNGVEVRTSLAGRSRASAERAAAAGMRDVDDAALIAAPIVLSIVPPAEAIATAERFAALARRTDARPLYADLNAISPETAARVAAIVESAGITKGLTALASAMMLAATRAGAAEALHAELSQSQPQLLAWFGRMVPGMYSKAYRWVGEMEEIADFVGRDRAEGVIYDGAARLYARLAADEAGERREIAQLQDFLRRGAKPG